MSYSAPSTDLPRLFSELEQMFRTGPDASVPALVRGAERALAEHLNQAVRRLRQAADFSEIALVLVDASAPFCRTGAAFRVNNIEVTGERLRGAATDAATRFRELRFEVAQAAAFAGVMTSREPVVALCSPAEISPAVADFFKSEPHAKCHLFPLFVGQAAAGVLYAEGDVETAGLELLAQAASVILESRERPAPSVAAELVQIGAGVPKSAEPVPELLNPKYQRLHLEAQRFASVRVAAIRLYRAAEVESARARDGLYSALRDSIDAARDSFRQNFLGVTPSMPDYLHKELVHTLANDNPACLGEEYPGPLV